MRVYTQFTFRPVQEVIIIVATFIVTVATNVVSYFVCKWLDKHNK